MASGISNEIGFTEKHTINDQSQKRKAVQ